MKEMPINLIQKVMGLELMSSNTWTLEELLASVVAIETTAWRVVEAQHCVSTMKLVDTLDEQKLLEDLL